MPLFSHEVKEREKEGIVFLDLKGHLSLGSQDSILRRHLESLLGSGKKNVIVNLQHVSAIDPVEIDTLALFEEEFQKAGGRLALLNPAHEHVTAGEVLQMASALPTYAHEQDAINSFFPDRKVPHYDLLEFLEEETQHHAEREVEETS